MSILSELNTLLSPVLPLETGIYSGTAPDEYLVLIPLTDTLDFFTDDKPLAEISEVRISIYSKGNYNEVKNTITNSLLQAEFTITDRRYLEFEEDTLYHHYAIDVAKNYEMEE